MDVINDLSFQEASIIIATPPWEDKHLYMLDTIQFLNHA